MEKQKKGVFEKPTIAKNQTLNQIEEVEEVDIENIEINHQNKPLVICYGPAGIGKTVTILRLISHIEKKYKVTPVKKFQSNGDNQKTITQFQKIRENQIIAPDSTGNVNFLLLDVSRSNSGKSFCNILEAPGEHFFKTEKDDDGTYPNYLNRIFSIQSYRKIYVFFFALDMLKNESKRKSYADKIVRLITTRIDPKRDKVIILMNKCDENHQWFRNGKPVIKQFSHEFYTINAFSQLKDLLKENGFNNVPFVPFSSGDYTSNNRGEKTYSPSPDHYPIKLWDAIYNAVNGKRSFLQRLFSF